MEKKDTFFQMDSMIYESKTIRDSTGQDITLQPNSCF